eukprot:872563-Rhodomonas_salina.1
MCPAGAAAPTSRASALHPSQSTPPPFYVRVASIYVSVASIHRWQHKWKQTCRRLAAQGAEFLLERLVLICPHPVPLSPSAARQNKTRTGSYPDLDAQRQSAVAGFAFPLEPRGL